MIFTLQYHDESGGPDHLQYPYWVGSISMVWKKPDKNIAGNYDYSIGTVSQAGYYDYGGLFKASSDNEVTFSTPVDDSGDAAGEDGYDYIYEVTRSPFTLSDDKLTLTLQTEDSCLGNLALQRVKPQ